MRPTLLAFELPLVGQVTLPAYFTLLAVGFGCALLLSWREARRVDLEPGRVVDVNLFCVLWGLVGARVLHVVADGFFGEYVAACLAPESRRRFHSTRRTSSSASVAHLMTWNVSRHTIASGARTATTSRIQPAPSAVTNARCFAREPRASKNAPTVSLDRPS